MQRPKWVQKIGDHSLQLSPFPSSFSFFFPLFFASTVSPEEIFLSYKSDYIDTLWPISDTLRMTHYLLRIQTMQVLWLDIKSLTTRN
jgi:hypothetical protein